MEFKLTVIKIEKDQVFLKDEKNTEIKLPKYLLSKNLKISEILYFSLSENRAKDILNEILNP